MIISYTKKKNSQYQTSSQNRYNPSNLISLVSFRPYRIQCSQMLFHCTCFNCIYYIFRQFYSLA